MNKKEQAEYDKAIAAIEAGKLLEERRYSDGTVRHFLDGAAILDKVMPQEFSPQVLRA